MTTIHAVRLKNLRCFTDTKFIDVAPITVLVGRNSAGKSTFARIFPLLRQSVEEKRRGPVLWWGRLVDFGSFNAAVNRKAASQEISLSFKLDLPPSALSYGFDDPWYNAESSRRKKEALKDIEVEIGIRPLAGGQGSFAASVAVTLHGTRCLAEFNESGNLSYIQVNELIWRTPDSVHFFHAEGKLIPLLGFFRTYTRKIGDKETRQVRAAAPVFEDFVKEIRFGLARSNTDEDTVARIAREIPAGTDEAMLEFFKRGIIGTKTIQRNAAQLSPSSPLFKKLRDLRFASLLPSLVDRIDTALYEFLTEVRYIKPLRATAQRYYRGQELAVDEIDPDGGNVPMFLDSLSRSEKESLNTWLNEYFGISVIVSSAGGHIEVRLSVGEDSKASNLADLGVGYSQLLPILLQIWNSIGEGRPSRRGYRERAGRGACIVIEQPELHLHPAYQAKIGNVFAAAVRSAKASDKTLNIVAETHSPHLINRLGELIENGELAPEDVRVVLFESSDGEGAVSVTPTEFDSTGVLKNWPFGFFEP